MNYVKLDWSDVVRVGDCRISCTGDLIPMPDSWVGRPVSDLSPISVGRPRSTVIKDALVRIRGDLIAEYGFRGYAANFSYVEKALGLDDSEEKN